VRLGLNLIIAEKKQEDIIAEGTSKL
jgi:hypothetical protein